MSLKKVEQVKADRGFRIWDLIIYGIIAVIIAVLFIVAFTAFNTDPLTGIKISVGSRTSLRYEVIFEYKFDGEPNVLSDTVSIEEDGKGITVTVKADNGDLNVIYIDKSEKSVKMINANCKGKDCMLLPINNNSGSITCNSHGLKIEPVIDKNYDSPDIIM